MVEAALDGRLFLCVFPSWVYTMFTLLRLIRVPYHNIIYSCFENVIVFLNFYKFVAAALRPDIKLW